MTQIIHSSNGGGKDEKAVWGKIEGTLSNQTDLQGELNLKADKTYVDTELEKKADKTYVDTELAKKSDKTYVDTELAKKANDADISKVGKSNDYNDLDNQPTIGGGVLIIKQNENTKATFNANATTNATAEIVVPTKVSELQNDANYLTSYTETDPTVPSHVKGITEANITSWNGKYAKPSTGIPKTDLAQGVQDSLNKADSALQSYTETDPTVPSHVKSITTTDISNWNGKGTYSKPSTGIPKTDLASAVQTSLGKADTAVQPSTLNSYATTTALNNGLDGKQDKALVTTLDNADDTHYPSAKAVADAIGSAGGGDMLKSVYDPTNKNGDVFNAQNHYNLDTELSLTSEKAVQNKVITAKINDIELSKAPNVSIVGEPTIVNGNISGFSASNYLIAPFLSSFAGYPFTFHMDITTGTDITTQQNIIDAEYGMAFAVKNGKFVIALSTNGTSWDLGEHTGTYTVKANTSYCVEIAWSGTVYTVKVSTDRVNFTTDITVNSSSPLSGNTLYLGGHGVTDHPFKGTFNMNERQFLSGTIVVWKGMDDAGLATRANLSLNNLNAVGEARFTAKQDVISDLTDIRNRATDWNTYKPTVTSHIGNGTIHVTASDKVAWSNKYAKPTNGIPKSDLDSGVQASLGLADTALQSFTETDPTVPSYVKSITQDNITSWNNKGTYSKPSGGIPKTDLASAVQTSLGKADTALQSYTETDPVFTASAAHGISQTDITNWNNKGTYSKPSGGIPKSDLDSGVQASLGKADTALQGFTESDPTVPSHVKSITSSDINNWNSKQNSIADLVNIRTGAELGATSVQPGTLTTELNKKQNTISDLAAIRAGASKGATALQSSTITGIEAVSAEPSSRTQGVLYVVPES